MYYLANLRIKTLINRILPDTLFKSKDKNKKVSYTQSKFGLAYFIIYFYV